MSNKATYQKRWFDQEDFVPEHDEMMIWLLDYKDKLFVYLYGDDSYLEIEQEPVLDGYPPVYPDAIAKVFNTLTKKLAGYLIIEIKPKIDSYGSVTRQFSLYRKRFSEMFPREKFDCAIITEDNRFDKYFSGNNIYIFHPSKFNF